MSDKDSDLILDLIIKKSIEDKRKDSYNDNFLRIECPQDYVYNSDNLPRKKEKEPSRVIIIEI